jgi:hypothetical protein
MPSSQKFFSEVARVSKPGARVLFAEPSGHVKQADFEREISDAIAAGFSLADQPSIRGSQTVLLQKS